MPFINTLGYEKTSFGDFARTLQAAQVKHVLDVRDLPLSRRAGFSKRQLAAGLNEFQISYTHLRGLGTPKEGRVAAKAKRMDEFHQIFAIQMATLRAQDDLKIAAELALKESCCLVCVEADPKNCHRSVVAEALKETTGLDIRHLHVE